MSMNFVCPLVRNGDGAPLFLVPSAGMTPLSLVPLARSLKSGTRVFSFVFPGLGDSRTPHQTIEEAATAYVDEIKVIQDTGPYYLGGHCFGGTIAFAMAARLEAESDAVAELILLESMPPSIKSAAQSGSNTTQSPPIAEPFEAAKSATNRMVEQIRMQISRRPPELAEHVDKFFHRQINMTADYNADPIETAIVLLRTPTNPNEVYAGWKRLSARGVTEHIISGNAFSILDQPEVGLVGAHIDEVLN